ncbi:transporter substrate-binding domain-containing protein [Kordiimonas laminariae]|uniref:transporter substrate-binding domain-containing protein n=1 Tax=Kordiimonas laminariae TaxID=2917717 RepID=UPI001FF31C8F|nr:transporter substrate-binding domain-containing protein [Kordiimonas laminariae]MCK0068183.1 transporter substrate-binding domain-containing protein [Kordiimonas laminariae]
MNFRNSLLALLFLSLSGETSADDTSATINIASLEIPYAYEENGVGVYHKVLEELTKGYDGNYNITFYPSARLTRLMINRDLDCNYISTGALDAWENNGITADELAFVGPIRELFVTVYVPASSPVPMSIEELRNLRLASDVNLLRVIRKYGLKEDFSLQSQVQMLNLLSIGRIEALVGFDFDLDTLAPRLGVSDKITKTDIKLDKLVDGIICFKNEKTAPFLAHLQSRLKEITESGWLDAEFDKFFKSQGVHAQKKAR